MRAAGSRVLRGDADRLLPLLRGVRPARARRAGQRAEQAGFHALWISDHYHPWNDEQGHSPFVWSVIGALARGDVAAGHHRRHLPDGAHPPGDHRPGRGDQRGAASRAASTSASAAARRSTSTSSATAGRRPTSGWRCSRRRSRSSARCGRAASRATTAATTRSRTRASTTCPDEPPPILVSGFGPKAIKLAARIGDGFVHDVARQGRDRASTAPRAAQGPVHAGTKVCFRPTRTRRARPPTGCGRTRRCRASWRRSCRRPRTSSRRASSSRPSSSSTPVGPGPRQARRSRCRQYADAGVDELFVQQIGPDQDAFFDEWAPEVLPRFV